MYEHARDHLSELRSDQPRRRSVVLEVPRGGLPVRGCVAAAGSPCIGLVPHLPQRVRVGVAALARIRWEGFRPYPVLEHRRLGASVPRSGLAGARRSQEERRVGLFGFEGDNAREKVIVLLTMCFALAMAMLDNTVVNVALPTISKDLGAGLSELQWIVDAYVLAFASLLLTGGILGDRYGRKRMFLAGLTVFTVFSLACGLATSPSQLIIARTLQGVGGALLIPGTLSIITVTFPPHERAKALGLWAGVSGIALALGPTLGGYMVEHLGWASVFFLNVPIGIVAFIVAVITVRESRSEQERKLDIVGLILGTSSLVFVTYGLIEGNSLGWTSPRILGSLLLFAVVLGGFLWWELRYPHAMMPLRFFKIR